MVVWTEEINCEVDCFWKVCVDLYFIHLNSLQSPESCSELHSWQLGRSDQNGLIPTLV